MYKLIVIYALLFFGACSKPNKESVLYDLTGEAITLPSGNKVLMFLVPDCPLALNYSLDFQQLADSLATEQVKFYAIIAGSGFNMDEITTFKSKSGLTMPLLIDRDNALCKKLKIVVSPEFVLVNNTFNVMYKGAFDNRVKDLGQTRFTATQHYVYDAIKNLLSNNIIDPQRTKAFGCFIEY